MAYKTSKYPMEREVTCCKCGCRMIVMLTDWMEAKRPKYYCRRPCVGNRSKRKPIMVVKILDRGGKKITDRDLEYHLALKQQKLGV